MTMMNGCGGERGVQERNSSARPQRSPFIIGVAGGTASGKSMVVSKIMEATQQTKRVISLSQESFYKPLSAEQQELARRGEYNFDHPEAFETGALVEALLRLQSGESVEVSDYDYITNSSVGVRTVQPADVILVEGILLFYDEQVRNMFHMKLFVDADADIRLARRVRRDTIERRRALQPVLNAYINCVKPSFEEFCLPSKKYADVIIPRGGENHVAIELIVQHIQDLLRTPRNSPELVSSSASSSSISASMVAEKKTKPEKLPVVEERLKTPRTSCSSAAAATALTVSANAGIPAAAGAGNAAPRPH